MELRITTFQEVQIYDYFVTGYIYSDSRCFAFAFVGGFQKRLKNGEILSGGGSYYRLKRKDGCL